MRNAFRYSSPHNRRKAPSAFPTYALLTAFFVCIGLPAHAASLACHYTYGGETHSLRQSRLASVQAAYEVKANAIGSYFLFRPVFEPGAVKLYTYVDRADGPALIHQASYAHPAATRAQGKFGFTGLQRVYEPVRDSELEYWCEIER